MEPEKMETDHLYLRGYKAGDGPLYYAAGMRNREHLAEFESGNTLMRLKEYIITKRAILSNLTY